MSWVSVADSTLVVVVPKFTLVAPARFWPETVTVFPPAVPPEAGDRPVTAGGGTACPPGVIHGYINESLEPVYFQVMLGRAKPETMGYADEKLYQRRDAHLGKNDA